MKNEKFCFSKGTGLIAVVGLVLFLVVFIMNAITSEKQTTNTKAFLDCPKSSSPVPNFSQVTCPWPVLDSGDKAMTITYNFLGKKIQATCCYFPGTFEGGKCPTNTAARPFCSQSDITGVNVKNTVLGVEWPCCKTNIFKSNNYNLPTISNLPLGKNRMIPTVVPPSQLTRVTPTALQPNHTQATDFCKSIGMNNILQTVGGSDSSVAYYNKYCKKYENDKTVTVWNQITGPGSTCYQPLGICSNSPTCESQGCIRGQSNMVKCLNMPVPFKNCVDAGVAQAKDAPDYKGMLCDDNETCSGVAIGSCSPSSIKKCVCKTGMSYPTFEDDAAYCQNNTSLKCMYGSQIVTTSSSPYKYITVNKTLKCIQKGDVNTGYRCKTDGLGAIIATGAVHDSASCPVPLTTCTSKDDQWRKDGYMCSNKYPYDKCVDTQYKCKCGSYAWPTLEKDDVCLTGNGTI